MNSMQCFWPILFVLLVLLHAQVSARNSLNDRPIIGILTQPTNGEAIKYGKAYIAASYVKWVESAGGRAVPIPYDATSDEIASLFSKINGIIFPGGGSSLDHSQLEATGGQLVQLVMQAKDKYGEIVPLHGTCMGFELLCVIGTGGSESILGYFDSENYTIPLEFTSKAKDSNLFGHLPENVVSILSGQDVTMNNHMRGIGVSNFSANPDLNSFYYVLSTNKDRNGNEFVSSIEAKEYPITGTQWHPEKNQFEFDPNECIQHTPDAILAMQYMARSVVDAARYNTHKFPSFEEEENTLMYNYSPLYTAKLFGSGFEQCYYF